MEDQERRERQKDMEKRLERLALQLDPRYMSVEKALSIYKLMLYYHTLPMDVLEIGTYCGTGAVLLSEMVRDWGGRVVTIDLPWTENSNECFDKNVDYWIKKFHISNLSVVRRKDGAQGWFLERAEGTWKLVDFVYLDGGHDWEQTAALFAMSYGLLRVGGWLCMDDIHNVEYPEVGLVWENIVLRITPSKYRYETGNVGFVMRHLMSKVE